MDLQWEARMTTGVAEVDDAHETLILWINKPNTDMASGQGRGEVLRILTYFTKTQADLAANGVTSVTVITLQRALGNSLRNHTMKIDTALLECVSKAS